LTVREAISRITERTFVLPAIQREFVWKPDQIIRLFDSLITGFPIGSFLFWTVKAENAKDYEFYDFIQHYHERDATHNKKAGLTGAGAGRLTRPLHGVMCWSCSECRQLRTNQPELARTAMTSLRLACRTLGKTPLVTSVAVLSLALGIGVNTAIFSLFDQVVFRPLPVPHPERIVNLSTPGWKPGSMECNTAGPCGTAIFSYPMFRDLERAHSEFSGIAAHFAFPSAVAYRGQTLTGQGEFVSGSYFPVLGTRPALGRLLAPSDDETIGANFVAVLSYDYWANELGSDATVLNQSIRVNGQQMTIVGVAPKGFDGTTLGVRPKVFVPISMRAVVDHGFDGLEDRHSYWVYLFARLDLGVSIEQGPRLDQCRVPANNQWGRGPHLDGGRRQVR
jgi:hypothetical protein